MIGPRGGGRRGKLRAAGGPGSFKPSRVGAPDGPDRTTLTSNQKQEVRATKVGPGKVDSSMIHKRSEVLG